MVEFSQLNIRENKNPPALSGKLGEGVRETGSGKAGLPRDYVNDLLT